MDEPGLLLTSEGKRERHTIPMSDNNKLPIVFSISDSALDEYIRHEFTLTSEPIIIDVIVDPVCRATLLTVDDELTNVSLVGG